MKTNDKVYANLVQNLVRFGNKPRKPLSRKALLVQSLHGGEQQDVADGCGIGQQHHETVDAEAQTAGRGQDGLDRPSGADFCCITRVFAFLWRRFPRILSKQTNARASFLSQKTVRKKLLSTIIVPENIDLYFKIEVSLK